MSSLTFTLRQEPDQRLDLSALIPEKLVNRTAAQIAALELQTTRVRVTAGDIFKIAMGDPQVIHFIGGSGRFDWLGAGMSGGQIRLDGDAGAQAGRLMAGGQLTVSGSVGVLAASGLTGGRMEVAGNAGDFLGGPGLGEMTGMGGGLVIVRGNAGERAAERMRRGVLIIEGNSGAYAGCRMIAGTLIVCGKAGRHPGALMQRGTIVLAAAPADMLPAFADCGPQDLVITRLMARDFAQVSRRAAALLGRKLRRLAGDMSQLGNGEILLPA